MLHDAPDDHSKSCCGQMADNSTSGGPVGRKKLSSQRTELRRKRVAILNKVVGPEIGGEHLALM
jgi:hypothetical protein